MTIKNTGDNKRIRINDSKKSKRGLKMFLYIVEKQIRNYIIPDFDILKLNFNLSKSLLVVSYNRQSSY